VSIRPDLVECWVFRVDPVSTAVEILLIKRAPHRIFPGLWQCVTGGVEPGERIPMAALREVEEETGLGGDAIEAFFDLDQVAPFYDEGSDAVVVSAIFAVRVRPDAAVRRSHEHDDARWMDAAEAARVAVWPSYRQTIERIVGSLTDAAAAPWFELTLDGRRMARPPREG
jgi:8-oxo-dGTP pyrophosphatase MutT (NUDIX family)